MDEERADFYVYEHIRPDTGAVFYVGKGHAGRAWNMAHRSHRHKLLTAKLRRLGVPVEVRIVETGLTEASAFALEVERIAQWSVVYELLNLTAGGEGIVGYVWTEEAKARKREVTSNPEFRAAVAENTRAQWKDPKRRASVSEKARQQWADPESRAKKLAAIKASHNTPEHKRAASERMKAQLSDPVKKAEMAAKRVENYQKPGAREKRFEQHAHRGRPVVCLDTKEVFSSTQEVARTFKVQQGHVVSVCQRKRKTTGGYRFAYADEDVL
jgi:hypothetical protein